MGPAQQGRCPTAFAHQIPCSSLLYLLYVRRGENIINFETDSCICSRSPSTWDDFLRYPSELVPTCPYCYDTRFLSWGLGAGGWYAPPLSPPYLVVPLPLRLFLPGGLGRGRHRLWYHDHSCGIVAAEAPSAKPLVIPAPPPRGGTAEGSQGREGRRGTTGCGRSVGWVG